MPQLYDNLIVFRHRTQEEREEEPIVSYNGREISEGEQEIIKQANRLSRVREASMLNGLIK